MSSRNQLGSGFEEELCETLSQCGFWAHRLNANKSGQPFDIIAAKDGQTYPLECKHCSKDKFETWRIEENQYSAMYLWQFTGNGESWFALMLSDGDIFLVPYSATQFAPFNKKVWSEDDIRTQAIPIDRWVTQCG